MRMIGRLKINLGRPSISCSASGRHSHYLYHSEGKDDAAGRVKTLISGIPAVDKAYDRLPNAVRSKPFEKVCLLEPH